MRPGSVALFTSSIISVTPMGSFINARQVRGVAGQTPRSSHRYSFKGGIQSIDAGSQSTFRVSRFSARGSDSLIFSPCVTRAWYDGTVDAHNTDCREISYPSATLRCVAPVTKKISFPSSRGNVNAVFAFLDNLFGFSPLYRGYIL